MSSHPGALTNIPVELNGSGPTSKAGDVVASIHLLVSRWYRIFLNRDPRVCQEDALDGLADDGDDDGGGGGGGVVVGVVQDAEIEEGGTGRFRRHGSVV